jgi:hypothetical protein
MEQVSNHIRVTAPESARLPVTWNVSEKTKEVLKKNLIDPIINKILADYNFH